MVGVVAFFILNSVAFALVGGMNFADQSKFADWNRTSINHLKEEGIVKGYGDGEFKPENSVTRAEMAVMMDRMYDNLIKQTGEVTMAYDDLKDIKFEEGGSAPKVALAMGIARIKKLENFKPESVTEYAPDFKKLSGENIPKGYEVYQLTALPTYQYYVHWQADEFAPESDATAPTHFDEWYGPFDPSVWYNNG